MPAGFAARISGDRLGSGRVRQACRLQRSILMKTLWMIGLFVLAAAFIGNMGAVAQDPTLSHVTFYVQ
jgi:hypothetical protein